jgi:aryl-alcohol dehydrogenase-like predicted oxidoreductase
MLTGKMTPETTFPESDHRNFNRDGAAFDRGETFSGVDFETGLQAVADLEEIRPASMSMVQFALRWILMFDAVTCAIPGAKRPSQAEENLKSADLPQLSDEVMTQVRDIYDRLIRDQVHHYW